MSLGRIAFVLDGVELNGGNKQIYGHARLLAESGYDVTIVGNGPMPTWMPLPGPYFDWGASDAFGAAPFDLCIFTYFSSYRAAPKLRFARPAHFCQGYEKFAPHLGARAEEIDAFYRATPRTLCISETMQRLCVERYGKRCERVEPIVEPFFRPRPRLPWSRRRPRVLVPGIYELPSKGVPLALAAVARAAAQRDLELYRLSTFPRSPAEAAFTPAAIWLEGRAPAAVAAILRGIDLVVTLPTEEEGFGLPALEAIACGVPVVCSPTLAYAPLLAAGAAQTAATPDADSYAATIAECLSDCEQWRAMRRAGIALSARFRADAQRARTASAVAALLD